VPHKLFVKKIAFRGTKLSSIKILLIGNYVVNVS